VIELPGLWSLTPIGFGIGVVAFFYYLLAVGRLIPRSSHERELETANKRGDEWKETALDSRRLNSEITRQNTELLEGSRTVRAVLRSSQPDLDEDTTPGGA
jgi:hypothetical protein